MWIRLTVWTSLLAIAIGVAICLPRAAPPSPPPAPASRWTITYITEPNLGRPMEFKPDKPFVLELARGGYMGMDTIIIEETGHVRLGNHEKGQTATFDLSPDVTGKIAALMQSCKLTHLARTYTTREIEDGSQWYLVIKQAGEEKVVCFDNHFPPEILSFAKNLDELLSLGGGDKATWTPCPDMDMFGSAADSEEFRDALLRRRDEKMSGK